MHVSFQHILSKIQPQRWSRNAKRLCVYGTDYLMLLATVSLMFIHGLTIWAWGLSTVIALISYTLISVLSGSHRTIIHSSNLYILPRLGINVLGTFAALQGYIWMRDLSIPSVYIACYTLIFSHFLLGSRIIARYVMNRWFSSQDEDNPNRTKTIIYGAGYAGKQVLQALGHSSHRKVVAVIDDNKELHNQLIGSTKIYRKAHLPELIEINQVKEIILAMPSLRNGNRKSMMRWLQRFPVKLSIVPDIENIVDGQIKINDIKQVRIEDLLSRQAVEADPKLIAKCTKAKRVLVSGAGGSIGSEICRQVLQQEPLELVLFEISEYNLYQIERELIDYKQLHFLKTRIVAILGDVKNENQVHEVLQKYRIQTVYHAAAYKHVPLVEFNAQAGFENNVIGTRTMAEQAGKLGVHHFVLVSTDKAVRPTNIMGATKRLAEQSVQSMQDKYPDTVYSMVRFGNVLGSSGSVIPLFRKQIAEGGPVTVTDPEMIRYFMTIPEAASLVIQAGAMAQGGDVYLLDMGEPVKILDLAKRMIHLSGYRVQNKKGEGDIAIEYVGLRPGEKLYEELLIDGEVTASYHPRIFSTIEKYPEPVLLEQRLQHLHQQLREEAICEFKMTLKNCVEGYQPKMNGVKVEKTAVERI